MGNCVSSDGKKGPKKFSTPEGLALRKGPLPTGSPGRRYPKSDIRHMYALNKEPLGRGSFGLVLKAKHRKTGQTFAVKVVDKTRFEDINVQEMVYNEISIMRLLKHKNILKFYDFYEDSKFCYSIFDLCNGGELFDEIQRLAYFTEANAVKLIKEMLLPLAYMHKKGICHRDLKAENFLFFSQYDDSILVMIDFGLATPVKVGEKLRMLCGSPRYMAPEVFMKEYNEKCDVWSIGVISFLMLYGSHPFGGWPGATIDEISEEVKNMPVDFAPYEDFDPPSEKAIDFLSKCLERDIERRMTAEEALNHPWMTAPSEELNLLVVDASVRTMAAEKIDAEKKPVFSQKDSEQQLETLQSLEKTLMKKPSSKARTAIP